MASQSVDISNHPDIGGLFHCTKDCPVCITTMFCPCITYGLAMNELIPEGFGKENHTCRFAAQCLFLCPALPHITERYAFTNERISGLCSWYFCNPCYLCQLRRVSKFVNKMMKDMLASASAEREIGRGQQQVSVAEGVEAEEVTAELDSNTNVITVVVEDAAASEEAQRSVNSSEHTPPVIIDALR
jgi:Cys-rich protein (TIGR01571 family)